MAQLFLSSCALKVSPSGGDKDVVAPVAKKYDPENLSVNFSKKEIVVTFNEFIVLKELDKQLIISPIIKPAPTISVKGKSLVIEIKAALLPNTTYTFNLGNAITDLHEGNAMEDFRYIFSTGDFVDTLHIDGKVFAATDLKTEKGIMVMLYKEGSDSVPYLNAPDFFSRTDSAGKFSVRNISKGPYKIFALKDGDADYKFNSVDEQVGFVAEPVFADDSVKHNITLFKEIPEKLFVKNSYYENKAKVVVALNKPADVRFENVVGNTNWKYTEYSLAHDTIILWLTDTLTDSLNIMVSEKNVTVDTLHIINRLADAKRITASGIAKLSFVTNSVLAANVASPIMITASQPVVNIDTTKIIFTEDSTTHVPYQVTFTDSLYRTFSFTASRQEKKQYTLKMLPGAVQSFYGAVNDTTSIRFVTAAATDYGSVKIKLTVLDSAQYIIQLTTESDVPVYEKIVSANGEYAFENCIPAKYKLRVIRDDDGNKKFTTGKYLLHQQPEKVYYYKETINIRANWDIETDWVLINK